MISAILVLLACELAGDLLHQMLAFPVPGPVIGMSILVAALAFRREETIAKSVIADSLEACCAGGCAALEMVSASGGDIEVGPPTTNRDTGNVIRRVARAAWDDEQHA